MVAQLGRVRPDRLGVIARTSAARFKRSGRSIDDIARELRVAYVVEGSVRKSGGRVRITAQLVDATDQTSLWSDTYDGTLADCLTLQAEVAGRIARAGSKRRETARRGPMGPRGSILSWSRGAGG